MMCILLLACTQTIVWLLRLWYVHIKVDPVVCIMHIRPLKNGAKNSVIVTHKQNVSMIFLVYVVFIFIYFSVKDIFRSDT